MTPEPLQPRERITAAVLSASRTGEPALVAYLTAGFPRKEAFGAQMRALARAADLIEVGVPFTDPMADGVTIQRSSQAALAQGVTLQWILSELAALPPLGVPVLLMSYLNPLLAHGLERLAHAAARARVSGFIVPDLPFDESAALRAALAVEGLALVQMVTPVTRPERLLEVCRASEGFVYAVTMTGTTGRSFAVPAETLEYLDRVRRASALPVCAGFGIRERAQVERLRGHVDGVIVGSALVEVLERGHDPVAWLAALRGAR
ncbi:MAG TPA: tryptophan synthase subunit alpha [Steroidobacteraceae bacterium]|nr:tryptophan synthase subunit alpha [Steroidobacteraceae bacterium]